MPHEVFALRLAARRPLTPRVSEFRFERVDGQPFDYIPGQFVTLHFPGPEGELRRSYSIASSPEETLETRSIAIAVTEVPNGRVCRILFGLSPGEVVQASGPFGRFILRDDPGMDYLLVATGTGVSPYRAMLPSLGQRLAGSGREIRLLLGVRGPEELLYGEDFLNLARAVPAFGFTACLSRTLSAPPREHERQGYVQEALKSLALDPRRQVVYLCGNPEMIDVSLAYLKSLDFPLPAIRREKYLSSN
jgi:ferredoxin-NADP reductase